MEKKSVMNQKEQPVLCLQSIAASIQGFGEVRNELEMPSENEHVEKIELSCNFREEDPSKFYVPVTKLGSGGQATVYSVRRVVDNEIKAMKLMKYENEKTKK